MFKYWILQLIAKHELEILLDFAVCHLLRLARRTTLACQALQSRYGAEHALSSCSRLHAWHLSMQSAAVRAVQSESQRAISRGSVLQEEERLVREVMRYMIFRCVPPMVQHCNAGGASFGSPCLMQLGAAKHVKPQVPSPGTCLS